MIVPSHLLSKTGHIQHPALLDKMVYGLIKLVTLLWGNRKRMEFSKISFPELKIKIYDYIFHVMLYI